MHPLFALSLLIVSVCSLWQCGTSEPRAPALYVFGDSLVDSGNNNFLRTIAKSNYRPYGIDFPFSLPWPRPTSGRFTNGKTVPDFLAEYLELPYAPPYLNSSAPDVLTGYNYASASCGIINETGAKYGKCLSFAEQVGYFQETIETKLAPHFEDSTKLLHYLSKSIFVISIGNNDYLLTYFDPSTNASEIYKPEAFAKLLVKGYLENLEILYELGARKVLFVEVGALGCIPSSRSLLPPGDTGCDEEKNQIASIFNNELTTMIEKAHDDFPESYFTTAHVHELSYDAFVNPSNYGLTDSQSQCCLPINASAPLSGRPGDDPAPCMPPSIFHPKPSCINRNEVYFWDGYHPSEAFYSIAASKCLIDSSFCYPLNIQQLVEADNKIATSLYSVA